MRTKLLVGVAATLGFAWAFPATAQFPGLNAGTVTATVGGAPFSTNVSVATLDEDGTLILTHLGNAVQIQVEGAEMGTFEIEIDADGGLVGLLIGLQSEGRYISPVSGSLTIEQMDESSASGTFAFEGRNLADDSPVSVTDGRFDVRLTGGG